MKLRLGFATALVFVFSLGLSAAFAQSTKPAMQTNGQQGATKTALTSKKSSTKWRMMKKMKARHNRHHRKIVRHIKNVERERKAKKEKRENKARS
jgi:hypothetical protein